MFKLGCTPSPPEKLARALLLRDYLTLPQAPAAVAYDRVLEPWGMLGNDTVGDCTCAAAGHGEQVGSAYGMKLPSTITTADVLAAYSAITGYDPRDPSTDQGADPLAVLSYWRHHGIGPVRATAYVRLDPRNRDHWRAAIYLFGFVYLAVQLPDRIVAGLDQGRVLPWRGTTGAADPQNGHAVVAVAYDTRGVRVVTWGEELPASWAFLGKYCVEAFVVLLPTWAHGDPNGFNLAQLLADLRELRS